MIRIVIENLFFFLLPTVAYIAWIAFKKNEWPGLFSVLRNAPLVYLFVLGAALMLMTLALFSTRGGNSPDAVYVPSAVRDGRIEPGHSASPKPPPSPAGEDGTDAAPKQ